ncbi:Zn-dependent hydrolase [Sporosarcina sp. ACRSM]|uniref:Zn-dependent hydrolase n=1 Tax=Sporosarcina sp. ACRSM TaxID=2918216 RepID=UPI001EF43392|nr:Zn-dependent hydrolase [Sporosarcina sp. ACRSM]MCG7334999.1 Zn-dependent hydrolase [Sporosarcina sp. ACRSM]
MTVTNNMQVNIDRLKRTIDKSAQIGEIPGNGLCRLALTKEDKEMRGLFLEWMENVGLTTRVDDFGNIYGRREGLSDLAPVVIGSHLDTQPNGGRFDGILGVLAALEVIHTLNDNGIETDRPIEIVNFTNEEGARFEPPLLGSGGLVGVFDKEFVYSRKDNAGKTFEEELNKIGYKGSIKNRLQRIHSYIELHIEQGPVLENKQIAIGAVEGIKGMTWLEIKVSGESGHAGPTPMAMRRDALMAASKLFVHIEEKAKSSDEDISMTIGRMSIYPNVANCIPGEVVFSLDVRHIDDQVRKEFVAEIKEEMEQICQQEQVQLEITDLWDINATAFHPEIIEQIVKSAKEFDCSVTRMVSGAGHDAKYINQIAPTGMIFVPSIGGKSHIESELTLDDDIEKGANVLLHCVLQLSGKEELTTKIKESIH